MKKITLFLIAFVGVITLSNAQVNIFDLEANVSGKPDCNHSAEWPGDPNAPVASVVANPNTSGVNSTANCLKYVETASSNMGNSLQVAFNGTTEITGHNLATNKYVKFMVYSEDETDFELYLELGTGGAPNATMTKNLTVALNTWTVFEFDFTGTDTDATIANAGGWNSNLRFHFNNGTVGDGDTYYIDEYTISAASTLGGNDDIAKKDLSAFYSMSKDAVVLKSNNFNGDYKVYDLTGRAVLTGEISKEINVESLNSGIYIVSTNQGTLKFAK